MTRHCDLEGELTALELQGDLHRIRNPKTARKVWAEEDSEDLALHAVRTAHGLISAVRENLPAQDNRRGRPDWERRGFTLAEVREARWRAVVVNAK